MTDYDDLCKRLREDAARWSDEMVMGSLEREAADAIRTLREEVANAHGVAQACEIRAEKAEADNAALRAELDELAGQLALTVKELFETEDRTEAAKADNAALREQLAQATEAVQTLNAGRPLGDIVGLQTARNALAENAALRQDAERLDWLSAQEILIHPPVEPRVFDLRTAIDAAMLTGKEP